MTRPSDDADGIGTPGSGQPSFAPPAAPAAGMPATPPFPQAPGQPVPPPPAATPGTWAAPHPDSLVAPPPSGRRPPRPRRSRRVAVAAVLAGSLLLIGVLSVLPLLPGQAPAPRTTAPPALVTATPSPVPTAASTATGAGVGTAVAFTGADGSGTLTLTRAVWTDAGELAAPAGQRYLVLDVTISCTGGRVAVTPPSLLVTSGDTGTLPAFGPSLERPLAGVELSPGGQVSGQVGYALAPGAVRLHLLDAALRRLATVEVPAP